MARTGDVHTQPGGYRLSFTVTGADSGGGLLEMDVTYPAHRGPPAPHSHPKARPTIEAPRTCCRAPF